MLTNKIHRTAGSSEFLSYKVFHSPCGSASRFHLSYVLRRWGGGLALSVQREGNWTSSESQISHLKRQLNAKCTTSLQSSSPVPGFPVSFSQSPESSLLGTLILASTWRPWPLLYSHPLSKIQALKFPLTQFLPELKMQMCLLYCLFVLSFYKRLCDRHNALYGAVREDGGGVQSGLRTSVGQQLECFALFKPMIGVKRAEGLDVDRSRERYCGLLHETGGSWTGNLKTISGRGSCNFHLTPSLGTKLFAILLS